MSGAKPNNAFDAAAVIVAAGSGARAGDGPPKQYRAVAGRCALARSVVAAAAAADAVLVAIGDRHAAPYAAAVATLPAAARRILLDPVVGGATRQDSVRIALEALARRPGGPPKRVAIHDAARPFAPLAMWRDALGALDRAPGACPALPVADSLRHGVDGRVGDVAPRDGVWRAQTPQCFEFGPLLDAHRDAIGRAATDDAEIARRAGLEVLLTPGAEAAKKLTQPADFDWAEVWARGAGLAVGPVETRTGSGFDVHAFGDNADGSDDHVMLCGVRVPHDSGVRAHSDGDVGLHALTDAVLGALGDGDIGAHFPPTDPMWRGAASDQFLAHAAALAGARGQSIVHLDATLICERPKVRPFVDEMRARIAGVVGASPARVSVKATTTEALGFTGRREGIAAQATATLSGPPLRDARWEVE